MLSWDYYRKRKQLKLDRWLLRNNITSYEALCNTLCALGVIPPSKKESASFLNLGLKTTPPLTVAEGTAAAPVKSKKKPKGVGSTVTSKAKKKTATKVTTKKKATAAKKKA